MGRESCESCRSWVDDIYWTHFQFIHFAQFLRSGYDQQLALPKRFSDNLKKLPDNVALRGPGGAVWNIGLTTRENTLYFAHGWQQFVKDHFLEENDFLVFKYNGESQFDVLIFDGESFCEKASSYFVRKCGHTEHESECLNKRKDTDHCLEEVNNPSNAGVECASPEKSVHGNSIRVPAIVPSNTTGKNTFNAGVECASPEQAVDMDGVPVPVAIPSKTSSKETGGVECASLEQFTDADGVTVAAVAPSQTTRKRVRKLISVVNHVQTKRKGRPRLSNNARGGGIDWVPDSEPASGGKSGTCEALYTSNRRPVTAKEIKNALRLAQAACTNDSLLVVMRPTHVYKRFYVSIPGKWMAEHLSQQCQDVILRVGEREWHVRYSFNQARKSGGFTGAWKHFALDNNLQEFDVCVIKPTGQINDLLTMDVNIFRVIDEVTPLS